MQYESSKISFYKFGNYIPILKSNGVLALTIDDVFFHKTHACKKLHLLQNAFKN